VAASLAVFCGVVAALSLWLPFRPHLANAKIAGLVSASLFVFASGVVVWATARFRAELHRMSLARAALELGQEVGGVGTFEYNLNTGRIGVTP
jgi:hypothetical protein